MVSAVGDGTCFCKAALVSQWGNEEGRQVRVMGIQVGAFFGGGGKDLIRERRCDVQRKALLCEGWHCPHDGGGISRHHTRELHPASIAVMFECTGGRGLDLCGACH
jgi:hypothetical protein